MKRREFLNLRTINPWNPKFKPVTVKNQETSEQFLARGGILTVCPKLKDSSKTKKFQRIGVSEL